MPTNYITLTRQKLYEMVWSEPMISLAKSFGISDVALAKRCRAVDVPIPYRGYWARKAAGQNPPQLPLPKYRRSVIANEGEAPPARIPPPVAKEIIRDGHEPAVHFGLREGSPVVGSGSSAAAPPEEQRIRERLATLSVTPVASILEACAAVRRTARHLKHPRRCELRFERSETSGALLDLYTSKAALDRALLLADTFLKAAESMGWTFMAPEPSKPPTDSERGRSNNVVEPEVPPPPIGRLIVEGESIEFRIEERVRKEPREPTKAELAREKREYGFHAPRVTEVLTGALRVVRIDSSGWYGERRTSWYDRKGSLVEAKIPQILRAFYDHALVLKTKRAEEQRRAKERREVERRQRELQELREMHSALIGHLEIEAGAWFRARLLRRYVRALGAVTGGEIRELKVGGRRVDYQRWADEYVNQLDPLHPDPRISSMAPEHNPYYRADEAAVRESLARLLGLQSHRVSKIHGSQDDDPCDEEFD